MKLYRRLIYVLSNSYVVTSIPQVSLNERVDNTVHRILGF